MNKLLKWAYVLALFVAIVACKKEDEDPFADFDRDASGAIVLEGDIDQNLVLTSNNKYLLKGFVYVINGVVLTVEPGTIIKGDKDTKGTLVVEAGGKIIAEGTQNNPIVFTSNQPKGQRTYGDWGGIVLIGKAPHNQQGSRTFEGGIRGSYGTSNEPNDNSGTLKYVRIEFCGIALTPNSNSEINGLTMYGVGSGTTIEYVQVSYSGDDSFEWFGGTVNGRYLIAHRGWDDDFDADHGFVGRVQFGVSLRDPAFADQSTSNGFECDNFDPGTPATGPNNGLPLTQPIFANMSVFLTAGAPPTTQQSGSGAHGRAMHLRRNSAVSIYNSVLVGHPEGLRLDGTTTYANATSGAMSLQGIFLINNNSAVVGAGSVPSADAQTYFNEATRKNQIIASADIATALLNVNTFNLTAPNFLPQTNSPLLTVGNVATLPAGGFFQTANYIGAFGTTNWTQGWANFDPQNADY